MLEKDPEKRATMLEVSRNPWITNKGKEPIQYMFDKVLTTISLDLDDQQVEVIKDRRSEIVDKDLYDLNLSGI